MIEERYKRQSMIADWDQTRLHASRVMVVGAGTTGNEIIKNLALLGVGHLSIVDLDEVNEVNLSRSVLFRRSDIGLSKAMTAAARAQELNPAVDTSVFHGDIVHDYGSGGFAEYDAVFLATDDLLSRLWVSRACYRQRVWHINTGIDGWDGNIRVIPPNVNGCLECGWTSGVYAFLDKRLSCAGIGVPVEERPIAMVITTAAQVAAMATQEFVKWVMYRDESRWDEYDSINFNGLNGFFFRYRSATNVDCRSGHERVADNRLCTVSRSMRVADIKEMLCQQFGVDQMDIIHDHEIILSLVCRQCGSPYITSPRWLDGYIRHVCQSCGVAEVVPDEVSRYLPGAMTLEMLKIPLGQLLQVQYWQHDELVREFVRVVK